MLDKISTESIELERTQRQIKSLEESLNGKRGVVRKIGIYYVSDSHYASDYSSDLTVYPSKSLNKKLIGLLISDLEIQELAQKADLKKLCGDYAQK